MSKVVIFHHNDADGRCSAAIMLNYAGLNQCKTVEIGYKDTVDLSLIGKDDTVAIVDFSFKPDVMTKVRDIARKVIWCDHHVTAKEYGYNDLDGVRDFTNKGKAGCECTWEYCYPDKAKPEALQLLGDYDAWRIEMAPRSLQFYEGLKIEDTSANSKLWSNLLFNKNGQELVDNIVSNGKIALRYRDNYCSGMAKDYGYEILLCGHKTFVFNIYSMGNQGFPENVLKDYPVRISWVYDGKNYTVSMYSDTVDVSQLAKKFGGGGHKGAAGFITRKLPWDGYEVCEA